jgi:hypothetical protein
MEVLDTKQILQPFGTPLSPIDPTKTLRIVMQNTQYALQLTNDVSEQIRIIHNVKELQASMLITISPNVNFCNPSNVAQFKYPFRRAFNQIYVSAVSSNVGYKKQYFNRALLPGGAAKNTLKQWASKITDTYNDKRGHGTYSITTITGKNGKKLSVIGAYISVHKGTKAGVNTVHAQQTLLMEEDNMKQGKVELTKCPRKEAIKALSDIIGKLQEEEHAIIIAIDANQTPEECRHSQGVRNHTIEWLRIEHDLDDPFISLT